MCFQRPKTAFLVENACQPVEYGKSLYFCCRRRIVPLAIGLAHGILNCCIGWRAASKDCPSVSKIAGTGKSSRRFARGKKHLQRLAGKKTVSLRTKKHAFFPALYHSRHIGMANIASPSFVILAVVGLSKIESGAVLPLADLFRFLQQPARQTVMGRILFQ